MRTSLCVCIEICLDFSLGSLSIHSRCCSRVKTDMLSFFLSMLVGEFVRLDLLS